MKLFLLFLFTWSGAVFAQNPSCQESLSLNSGRMDVGPIDAGSSGEKQDKGESALDFAKDFYRFRMDRENQERTIQDLEVFLLSKYESGISLSLIEVTILQIVLRSKDLMVIANPDPLHFEKMKILFQLSYSKIAGKSIPYQEALYRPFARKELKDYPSNELSFHSLAQKLDLASLQLKESKAKRTFKQLIPLAMLFFGLTNGFGLEILGVPSSLLSVLRGITIGTTIGMIWENLFHDKFMHSGLKGRKLLSKIEGSKWVPGLLKNSVRESVELHGTVHFFHHHIVGKNNYMMDVAGLPTLEKIDVESELEDLKKSGVSEEVIRILVEETKLGTHAQMSIRSQLTMLAYTSPIAIFLSGLGSADPILSALVGGIFSQMWIYNIYFLHQSYHVPLAEAEKLSGIVKRIYLSMPLFKKGYLHHFVHHSSTPNNFQLFPIEFDTLRGTHQQINLQDLAILLEQDGNF